MKRIALKVVNREGDTRDKLYVYIDGNEINLCARHDARHERSQRASVGGMTFVVEGVEDLSLPSDDDEVNKCKACGDEIVCERCEGELEEL